jgi:hypothetical protein
VQRIFFLDRSREQDGRFPEHRVYQINAFHYTTNEETQIVHVFGEVDAHEEPGKNNVEQIDERIGKDRSLLLDVVLVGLEKNERENQMECEGRTRQNDQDIGYGALGIRGAGDPVEDEGDERVEGEKVGSKGDDEVRFRYRDASAAITGVKGLHGSSEEHREKGVRQFVPDDVGKYRLSEKKMDSQVGQTAREKKIGGIQPEAGGKNHHYQLPGESQAEGNECQAEKDFQYFFCHFTEVGITFVTTGYNP